MVRVAIVEDQTDFRELWVEILKDTEGYKCVAECATVAEALTKIPLAQPDVVLMDINLLPDGSGIACVRQLRPLCLKTEFMMFTIFEDDEHIFEAIKAGATGYILKNTSPTKVLDAIKELYEGGSPMSASIARRVLMAQHEKPKSASPISKTKLLSPKEIQILELLEKGYMYKEIAPIAHISIGMVKQYLYKVYRKMDVSNSREAIIKFRDDDF